jgi:predicted amidohydrolase YtcJ
MMPILSTVRSALAVLAVGVPWVALAEGGADTILVNDRYIVARDLDEAAPNPVWLEHTTGHYGVANTRAMLIAGLSVSTPDVAGGTIDRDAAGQPTGVLEEGAQDAVRRVIPAFTEHATPTIDGARNLIAHLNQLPKPPRSIHTNLISCGVKYFMDGSGGARTG